MVPGASSARRNTMDQVPFQCLPTGVNLKRGDGGCLAEDSLWFRKVCMGRYYLIATQYKGLLLLWVGGCHLIANGVHIDIEIETDRQTDQQTAYSPLD
jgi:hypothetical protein